MCCCFSNAPNWGPDPQPRHVPWLGIEPITLWFIDWHSMHWATPARLIGCFFKKIFLVDIITDIPYSPPVPLFTKPLLPTPGLYHIVVCVHGLCIHYWLFLVYALTRDWSHSLGLLGRHSNQLSGPARSPKLVSTLRTCFWHLGMYPICLLHFFFKSL